MFLGDLTRTNAYVIGAFLVVLYIAATVCLHRAAKNAAGSRHPLQEGPAIPPPAGPSTIAGPTRGHSATAPSPGRGLPQRRPRTARRPGPGRPSKPTNRRRHPERWRAATRRVS